MDIHGTVAVAFLVGLVNCVDALDVTNAQITECVEDGALGLFTADGCERARNADAGRCDDGISDATTTVITTTVIATTVITTTVIAFARNVFTTVAMRRRGIAIAVAVAVAVAVRHCGLR
jgi:hypothetical protein